MTKYELKKCIMCNKEYPSLKKGRKGSSASKSARASTTVCCSKPCSKIYNRVYRKILYQIEARYKKMLRKKTFTQRQLLVLIAAMDEIYNHKDIKDKLKGMIEK